MTPLPPFRHFPEINPFLNYPYLCSNFLALFFYPCPKVKVLFISMSPMAIRDVLNLKHWCMLC